MVRSVALVRTDFSEEIGNSLHQGDKNRWTRNNAYRATRRKIQEDAVLFSYSRENLKSYIVSYVFGGRKD
jgi:hypothetical protein